ncbi:heat shock protein 70 kDa 12A [Ceratobasidium sp. AG-Ba]|nr:heat shock protein 70 kDa 12A [Ceratobasidium sp. AG-Ba]QRW06696.1 heat shock protein 70 kDa 12A [Ceratobasidium sp. AG-Ba]
MRAFTEGPWTRPPKIILGIDIGTTQSAVAFAHLYPNGPQSLYRVSAWPGQETHRGESKIPTLVYYDQRGKAVSFGAEALKLETAEKAEEQGWLLARHFKLHLHPDAMKQKHNLKVQPLPAGIPLEKIYTDFMVYLMKHTQEFFEARIIDGPKVWQDLHKDMTIVIAHPNGWTIKEQNFLRKAAVAAKYTTEAKAHAQIHFVSEAEASVHFCMFHSDIQNRLSPNVNFIVCDAGGSTVDTTAYCVKTAAPMLELEEKKASACVQAGAVFVDLECENHLSGILNRLGLPEDERIDYLRHGVKDFENSAKKEFGLIVSEGQIKEEHRVDMGCRINHPEFKIRRGAITLTSDTIHGFFDNCVEETVASIRQQMQGLQPKHILLVGGFGDSPHLRHTLLSEFNSAGCQVTVANDSTSKAVADGAVIWCAKLSVTSRATRMPYGVEINDPYDSKDPDHAGRSVHRHDAGYDYVTGKWSQIVGRNIVMNAAEAMRESYWRSYKTPAPRLKNFTVTMFAWTIDGEPPNKWLRDKDGRINHGYEEICQVEADLSGMRQALKRKTGRDGEYYYLDFTMALQFGGTELQAFVEWEQDGETRTGPASILPSALTTVKP